jgi:hypothetical protein
MVWWAQTRLKKKKKKKQVKNKIVAGSSCHLHFDIL